MQQDTIIWVGLDVHKERISVCWYRGNGEAEELDDIVNETKEVRRLFKRLSREGRVRACYEAGPCGYEVRRLAESMGVHCEVIAPSLIPVRAGDRVKTDKRDARKLARLYRAGELTTIRVPTEAEESLRDLLRCREDIKANVTAARHRVLKFLLRHGRVFRETGHWSIKHWSWLRAQRFELAYAQRTFDEYLATLDFTLQRLETLTKELSDIAQQEPWKAPVARLRTLHGLQDLSALTLLAEVQDFRRFESPTKLMAFLGLTPGIHASGGSGYTTSITKTGNGHARRVLVEAAWNYRHHPGRSSTTRKKQEGQPQAVVMLAMKAHDRLYKRYHWLRNHGKKSPVAVVAVARELAAFVWVLMTKDDPTPRHFERLLERIKNAQAKTVTPKDLEAKQAA